MAFNGVLGHWGAFWRALIVRFFMVIGTALFILDVGRITKELLKFGNFTAATAAELE